MSQGEVARLDVGMQGHGEPALGEDSGLSVAAMLFAGLISAGVGIFLFVQAWIWSQRTYQRGSGGTAVAIALAGGLMVLLAGVALAGCVVLVLTFYL